VNSGVIGRLQVLHNHITEVVVSPLPPRQGDLRS
jgi:hypothetical protein